MGMRIVWGLHDTNFEQLVALFEAENLLQGYRDQLLRKWYDDQTKPISVDSLPDVDLDNEEQVEYNANRERLLDLGYDRWYNDEVHADYPRFVTKKYELWNSVPPNVERLVMHFDT